MCWFHATRNDLEPAIRRIEAENDLKYIAGKWYSHAHPETYHSALSIPHLGYHQEGNIGGSMSYLVGPVNCYMVLEEQRLATKNWDYYVDFQDNSECFMFVPGGLKVDGSMAPGSLSPASQVPEIRALCNTYGKMLTKGFARVPDNKKNTWYVGPEALDILRSGKKLYTLMGCRPLTLPDKYK